MIGIIAIICVQNIVVALGRPTLGAGWSTLASVGLVAGLVTANVVGVRWGARIQNATVFAKVLTLLGIGALGVFAPVHDTLVVQNDVHSDGAVGVLPALVPALFALGGYQQALWISGEVRDPKRNLPRAILIGVVLVIVLYLLANGAYLRLLGGPAGRRSVVPSARISSAAHSFRPRGDRRRRRGSPRSCGVTCDADRRRVDRGGGRVVFRSVSRQVSALACPPCPAP